MQMCAYGRRDYISNSSRLLKIEQSAYIDCNAPGHKGVIKTDNQNAQSVNWSNLSYSQ